MMSSLSPSYLYNFFKKQDKTYTNSVNHITENHKFSKKKNNDDVIIPTVQDPLLPLHLDLIKYQSDALDQKDKELYNLGLENEKVKEDLESLKRELEHQKKLNGQLQIAIEEKDNLLLKKSISRGRPKKYPDKDASPTRNSEVSSSSEPIPKKICPFIPHLTNRLYSAPKYTLDYLYLEEESEQKFIEVPSWRDMTYSFTIEKEGVEDLSDAAFQKRHDDHVINEKRRKKWDLQKMREEAEKVRRAQKEEYKINKHYKHFKPKKIKEVHSMFPNQEKLDAIEISEYGVPVMVFGHTLPNLSRQTYSLPWMKN